MLYTCLIGVRRCSQEPHRVILSVVCTSYSSCAAHCNCCWFITSVY